MPSNSPLKDFVESLLPFDEELFKAAISKYDELAMTAAAGGAFAAVVRASPDVFQNRSARLAFCADVSRANFFAGKLPAWMVEAAIQGALGSAGAIAGIPHSSLVEIHVVALELMAGRIVTVDSRSSLFDEALRIADQVQQSFQHHKL